MAERRPARRRATAALAAAASVALVTALLATPAAAQARQTAAPPDSLGLEPGTRVRLALGAYRGRVAGVIDSVLATGFVLDTAARGPGLPFIARGPELLARYRTMRVDYGEIERLEVSRGTSRARGLLVWGAVGGAAGALLGGLNSDQGTLVEAERESFATRALPTAIVGAVLGGAFGYFTGRERWAPVGWP